MDSLKKLKAVSWKNVEQQAEEIAGEILRARVLKRNSVEISGEIHPVNREYLIANGFKLAIEPTKVNISWPNIVVDKDEDEDESSSSICSCSDDESSECACDGCKCDLRSGGLGTDDLKNILTFILSSIEGSKNKK